MSTSLVRSSPTARAARAMAALALGLALGPFGARAGAQRAEPEPAPALTPVDILTGGMAAYVDALVVDQGPWRGQRVRWPSAVGRPESVVAVASLRWPVAVHGTPESVDVARAEAWREALEAAYDLLDAEGWPLPPPDGGRGGTDGLDVYVIDGPVSEPREDDLEDDLTRAPRRSAARFDAALHDAGHDAAIVHAVVSSDVPLDRVGACAVQLLASAGLFAADPAEAESLREATAAWLAWNLTGIFGCDEDALARQQRQSHRAFITTEPRDAEGAAIVLGALSARHDAHETSFLRDAWLMARQRTRDGGDLQGEPDLLRVLQQASTLAHDPMDRAIESMAVARYFAGARGTRSRPDVPVLAALPPGAEVPVFVSTSWERLPRTLRPSSSAPPLEPWGSAYARVDVRGAPAGSVLRVWLDGELGTEWSLVAVRLDAEGAERGRTRAPPTRTARGFIPVELGRGTAEVVLVVTNMPDDDDPRDLAPATSRDATIAGRIHRTGLDADAPGPGPHGFRLIVDRG